MSSSSSSPPRAQQQQQDDDSPPLLNKLSQQLDMAKEGLTQQLDMAKEGYEQLINAIIRPPRASYSVKHLGPSSFRFCNVLYQRDDVQLQTTRGLHLQASIWTQQQTSTTTTLPMVVYLHGNASARVEVLPQLAFLLAQGVNVCSLDFCGSGLSEGEYVSLGYFEQEDLTCLLAYLRATYAKESDPTGSSQEETEESSSLNENATDEQENNEDDETTPTPPPKVTTPHPLKIVLWGRSMGASTALMYASTDHDLAGLILDSPFCSLVQLCQEMVEKARQQGILVPGVLVSVALALIGRSVQQRAHFSIRDISPMDCAPSIGPQTPALFLVGEKDDFIPPHHSESICAQFPKGVQNNLLLVPHGTHNDPRPPICFEAAAQFLRNQLRPTAVLDVPKGLALQCPPWNHANKPHVFQAMETTTTTSSLENLGMTQERQEDIQNKLHQMMGQQK